MFIPSQNEFLIEVPHLAPTSSLQTFDEYFKIQLVLGILQMLIAMFYLAAT